MNLSVYVSRRKDNDVLNLFKDLESMLFSFYKVEKYKRERKLKGRVGGFSSATRILLPPERTFCGSSV